MSRYATMTDYSLFMSDDETRDVQWLKNFQGSVFFEHGYVADYFYITDISEASENPDAAREAMTFLGEKFYGGMRFADTLTAMVDQSEEQQFLKLLLGDRMKNDKREVVGAILGRYVDDEQIELVSMYGKTTDEEAAALFIKRQMIKGGYVIDHSKASAPTRLQNNWIVTRPAHMDFRS